MQKYQFTAIGKIQSVFKEKFGVPRQSNMMSEARGVLKLLDTPELKRSVEELHEFSHLWVVYVFHKNLSQPWRPTIEPPRVDGPDRVGVLASRSPHRPNPIGISALRIESIDLEAKNGVEIHVSGLDILDETPVLDIKPYLPFSDSIPSANPGWAKNEIPKYSVSFSEKAKIDSENLPLLIQMLELDPRPTSQRRAHPMESPQSEGHPFAFRFLNFDVRWKIRNQGVYVIEILRLT